MVVVAFGDGFAMLCLRLLSLPDSMKTFDSQARGSTGTRFSSSMATSLALKMLKGTGNVQVPSLRVKRKASCIAGKPTSDGVQHTSDGLQLSIDGLQLNIYIYAKQQGAATRKAIFKARVGRLTP